MSKLLGSDLADVVDLCLIAYLMIMFQIVVDLFRDPDLGGGPRC